MDQSLKRSLVVVGSLLLHGVLGGGSVSFGQAGPQWQSEWERTMAAAKREGQINVYTGYGPVLDAGVFQKAYPGIKVVGVTGRGGQIAQRILAERRAGKYLADVVMDGPPNTFPNLYRAGAFDPIKPLLILPEILDESKWWQGKHRYTDPEGQHVFRFVATPTSGGSHYNTNLVDAKEIRSTWDLLHPRWKGKIITRDIRDPGPGNGAMRFIYHHPDIGPNFLTKLVTEMDVTIFRDVRLGTDWLAQGKYALCFFCVDVVNAKRLGLPVDSFGPLKEGAGLVSHYGTLGLLNKAPHPNAAKLFINWFLSREGQLTLQRSLAKAGDTAPDSLRIDIPKDDVRPDNRRHEGIRYLDLDTSQERLDFRPILKLFEESLAKAGKK